MLRIAYLGKANFAAWRAAAQRQAGVTLVAADELDLDRLLGGQEASFDAVLWGRDCPWPAASAARAARAGKHVFVEHPSEVPAEAGDALAASCQAAGVVLMMGLAERFRPAYQAVHGALAAGQLGDPGLLRVHHWRAAEPAGGDQHGLAHLTPQVDLALWLFGQAPSHVYALDGSRPDKQAADYLQVHLGFSDGGMALLDLAALPAGDPYRSLSLIGSSGAAYADDHHNKQLLFRGGTPAALHTGEGQAAEVAQLVEFTAAIQQRRAPSATWEAARAAGRTAAAALASAADRRVRLRSGESDEFV